MQKGVMVIGAGVAGIQTSLDLANRGFKVYLVEKSPSIGGRMAQLDKTFPTMDCSICILAPKMIECSHHPNVQLLTYSEVREVRGSIGNFKVKVLKKARYVDEAKCNACGICEENCPVETPNEFDENIGVRKAIYIPFQQAVPRVMVIDKDICMVCDLCEKICPSKAINMEQQPTEIELDVGAIVVATGFDMFDPSVILQYGYKNFKNVITAMELERLLCASGPTGGHLVRPSDGKIPRSIAFITCIGSRDRRGWINHPYCSSVCCKYAVKNATLMCEHNPGSRVTIFYIDMRAFGKGFQDFVNRAKSEFGITFMRSNPGEISEDPATKDLAVFFEDQTTRTVQNVFFDLVVLCPALVPRGGINELAKITGVELDNYGFFKAMDAVKKPLDTTVPGILACGYCLGPKSGDIPDSITQGSAVVSRVAEFLATKEGS
ncbi:MAG: CoB--CoM heterodisulfide reductase iron-sulfur subunit A family protein [Candidatus Bathyarchaeota archaeon]